MTPDQIHRSIESQYAHMLSRAARKEINEWAIEGIIEVQARAAARHIGMPEAWHSFMPKALQSSARGLPKTV
jgi:hypothetical protein